MSTANADLSTLPLGNRMMRVFQRGFELALAGAIGAVFGLYFYVELIHTNSLVTRDVLAGALIGGSIGFFLNASDGYREGAWRKMSRTASWGAIVGAIGGALGLWVGEKILTGFQGGLLGRAISWAVLGLGIGVSQGLAYRSIPRLKFGLLGGGIGGLVGGFFFEAIRARMGSRIDLGQALGIVILGGGLGLCLALIESVLGRAWVQVMSGRQEGRSYLLTGQKSTLGLDERADVGLFGDPAISRLHAEIIHKNGVMSLVVRDGNHQTKVNGSIVTSPSPLSDGDRIELGSTLLVFRKR